MLNFVDVVAALKAGHIVKRDQKSNRNGNAELFLRTIGKREFLFARTINAVAKTINEAPASLDLDDITSTNWQIVS